MTDDTGIAPDTEKSLLSKFTLQIEALVAGSFAGVLFAFLAAYCNPDLTGKVLGALGPALSTLVVLFVGIDIYVAYRSFLGEWLFYPSRHWLHNRLDELWKRLRKWNRVQSWRRLRNWLITMPEFISYTALLGSEGVPRGFRRFAYSDIRNSEKFFDRRLRETLDLTHSTYHFLYLTAVESFGAAVYRYARIQDDWKKFFWVGVVALLLAFIADLRQDTWECFLIARDRKKLRDHLSTLGFSPPSDQAPHKAPERNST